jgi:phospholipase C
MFNNSISLVRQRNKVCPLEPCFSRLAKSLERCFGLPTLASINHQFDTSTPGMNKDAAHDNPPGPPAPPRDAFAQIGDCCEVLDFS